MTIKNIALLNLWRRKSKAAFILAGLMIGVSTMVALVSMTDALTSEIQHKLEKYGANMLIVPRTEKLALSYEGTSLGGLSVKTGNLKEQDLDLLKNIKNASNVAAVGPMVMGTVKIGGQEVLLSGIDFKATQTLKPWWKIDGQSPGPDELIAGSEAARVLGLVKGQVLEVGLKQLKVSGILESTGSQDDSLLFTPLPTAQSILGRIGEISMAEVAALCNKCPIDEMVHQIGQVLPGAKVTAIQAVVKGRMETIRHFKNFSFGVSALVFLVGCLLVLVTMMSSVKERTAEIGVFRAIGFRQSHIMRLVLFEALIISAVAGLLGYMLGFGLGEAALPLFAENQGLHVPFLPFLALGAMVTAIVLGLLSSLYPAVSAARLDPHEALRTL